MTIRNILVAAAAGLMMGVSAGPDQVEAAPAFPIVIDFNYCWGSTSPCPRNYVDAYTLQDDNTWRSDSGYIGTWNWTRATKTVAIVFDNPGTVYYGIHEGKGTLSGTCEAPQYTNYGTWSGQVQL